MRKRILYLGALISALLCGVICFEAWRGGPLWFVLQTVDSPVHHDPGTPRVVFLIRQIVMTPTIILAAIALTWIFVAVKLQRTKGPNKVTQGIGEELAEPK